MVSAGRVAMAWITVLIVIITVLLLFTVLSPQVVMWQEVVTEMLMQFSAVNYNDAVRLTWFGFKVFPLIVCFSIIVWAVLTSLSEEFQSDLGDM